MHLDVRVHLGTLKDLSLSLCCVNEQSVLLVFSQPYLALDPALPVVTGKPMQFKSADIVLAVGSAQIYSILLCFLPSAAIKSSNIIDGRQSSGKDRKVRGTEENESNEDNTVIIKRKC